MKRCPYCAKAIQRSARVCHHCGRNLKVRVSTDRYILPGQRRKALFLAVGVALILMLVVIVILKFSSKPTLTSQPTITIATPEPSPTIVSSSSKENRRLFLENNFTDATARERIFKQIVSSTGERCDRVERPNMRSPGNWIITCKPGHIYTFKFDEKGELKEVRKMN
jgi:hypothetical protein